MAARGWGGVVGEGVTSPENLSAHSAVAVGRLKWVNRHKMR